MPEQVPAIGTKEEQKLFHEVDLHYQTAKEDLDVRRIDFDKRDILFRSHLEENNWPYRALVFDPRIFTALYEKTARTLAQKPRGRMIPREGGDVVKAKINNELLNFQWDDNVRVNNDPMIAKWAQMDLNARKYGASFGLCTWHWERKLAKGKDGKTKSSIYFDGPNFVPLNNRDCLANPSYSSIKNWFQHRSYPTLQELENVNDAARSKPVYKNLDLLRQRIKEESERGGDRRDSNYQIKNKTIKGLTDYLGSDAVFKTVEIVTEYRNERWITFAPKHGVILRDIPNPYDHGQIPIVMLKYYPIDDDLYGLSEIEPIEKLQKAVNALLCQYLDAINMSLYAPLKISSVGGAVQMHTIEFGPGAKWLMQNPSADVVTHDQNITGVQEFTSTYRFLISAMQEALGETSAGISNLNPGEEGKTATEVKDLAMSRSARDNFNQIFLAEALKKQMMFWHTMNQQLLFSTPNDKYKIIQIVGKDAIKYFQKVGMDGMGMSEDSQSLLDSMDPEMMEGIDFRPEDLETPMYPVETPEGIVPKFNLEETGEVGSLIIEPGDLNGIYDYIPDVGSMSSTANDDQVKVKTQAMSLLLGNQVISQMLMQEGKRVKAQDFIVDYLEDIGFKNADQYIESINQGGMNGIVDPGTAGAETGAVDPVTGQPGGVPTSTQAIPGGQAQPVVS